MINSATGEPVSGALVQLAGEAQFSDSDGAFAFKEVPRGQFSVTVRKPGFFNDQELGRQGGPVVEGPPDKDLIVKLTPEGIIYGDVKTESGKPIEDFTVKALRWQTRDGQRRMETAAIVSTDDRGDFRIAELPPGSYYLSFAPGDWTRIVEPSAKRQRKNEGYGLQFYPGTSDAASPGAVTLRAGAQVHIAQALTPQRVFQIMGTVRGSNPAQGFSLSLVNATGESVGQSFPIGGAGDFRFQGVPAGTYLLIAWDQRMGEGYESGSQQLGDAVPISVTSDVTGLALVLHPVNVLRVRLRDEIPDDDYASQAHHVMIRINNKVFEPFSQGMMFPRERDSNLPDGFEGLVPGIYSVEARAAGRGYIADLRCGRTDLLRDDLTVASGASLPPIDVTLRDDGARLDGAVSDSGQPSAASVVIYSEEYPRRSVLTQVDNIGSFSAADLPPGMYQVFAVQDAENLEYRDPLAVDRYLTHAKILTLGPREKATVRLELQHLENQR